MEKTLLITVALLMLVASSVKAQSRTETVIAPVQMEIRSSSVDSIVVEAMAREIYLAGRSLERAGKCAIGAALTGTASYVFAVFSTKYYYKAEYEYHNGELTFKRNWREIAATTLSGVCATAALIFTINAVLDLMDAGKHFQRIRPIPNGIAINL